MPVAAIVPIFPVGSLVTGFSRRMGAHFTSALCVLRYVQPRPMSGIVCVLSFSVFMFLRFVFLFLVIFIFRVFIFSV